MRKKSFSSAAPALVFLILSSLLFGGAARPAAAFPWGPGALALSPDGQRLYVTDPWSAGIAVIDTATNQLVKVLRAGGSSLAVSPDGTELYGVSGTDLNLISLTTGRLRASVKVGNDLGRVVVSPDGRRVYVANDGTGSVAVIDPAADQVIAEVAVGARPDGMAIQPDGQRLYVAVASGGPASTALSGRVAVIDTASNRMIGTVAVHAEPDDIAVSPDGQRVYVTHSGAASDMDVINTASLGRIGSELEIAGGHASAVAVGPDGRRLYIIASEFPIVAAIDGTGGGLLGVAPPENGPVGLVVSPDGRRVYVADRGGTLIVLDAGTLQEAARVRL